MRLEKRQGPFLRRKQATNSKIFLSVGSSDKGGEVRKSSIIKGASAHMAVAFLYQNLKKLSLILSNLLSKSYNSSD